MFLETKHPHGCRQDGHLSRTPSHLPQLQNTDLGEKFFSGINDPGYNSPRQPPHSRKNHPGYKIQEHCIAHKDRWRCSGRSIFILMTRAIWGTGKSAGKIPALQQIGLDDGYIAVALGYFIHGNRDAEFAARVYFTLDNNASTMGFHDLPGHI